MEALALPHFPHNTSWVDSYLESPWVKVIAAIAPAFPPPGDTDSKEWRHFATELFIGGGILAGVGVLAAIAVLIKSCVSCRRRPQARPSTKPLVCHAVVTLLLTLLGVAFYWSLGSVGVNDATTEFKAVTADFKNATTQGQSLATIGTAISQVVNGTIPKCKPEYQQALKAKISAPIEDYRTMIAQFNDGVKDLPRQLDKVVKLLDQLSTAGVLSLAFPLALSLLCVLAIVFVVCVTRGGRGSGNCSHCCVRLLGPLLFAPAILVVTAFTATEFGISLGTASFCKDADTNTLSYVHKYGTNETYQVAEYYITGKGTNPFLDDLEKAQELLQQTSQMVEALKPSLEEACTDSAADISELEKDLKETIEPLNVVQELLMPHHVYNYYKKAVHEDACKELISGVCWLVVFQLLVGLICLPCLTLMADGFFERWRAWHSSPGRQGLIMQEMSV